MNSMSDNSKDEIAYGLSFCSASLFHHAERASLRCQSEGGEGDVISSIVLSVVALESFINELGEHASIEQDCDAVKCFASLMTELEDAQERLRVKYQLGYFVLSGTACPMNAQPWQDFSMLIRVRNKLVHNRATKHRYNVVTQQVVNKHDSILPFLANKKLIRPLRAHGGQS